MRKSILFTIFLIGFISAKSQDVVYYGNENMDAGINVDHNYTERNYPDYLDSIKGIPPFTIIPCRTIKNYTFKFPRKYTTYNNDYWNKLNDPLNINYDDLKEEDKAHLYQLVLDTQKPQYFNLLTKLVLTDTLQEDEEIREYLATCLGIYKTDECRKLLYRLLNDPKLNIIAALDLVQIGDYARVMDYFTHNYVYEGDLSRENSALMQINSPQSVSLLKKIASDPKAMPVNAIDALAALSLMGYCDFAKKGFISFTKHFDFRAREKAVSCLAYYIGTKEAFDIISQMQNDASTEVKKEVRKVLHYYFQQNGNNK